MRFSINNLAWIVPIACLLLILLVLGIYLTSSHVRDMQAHYQALQTRLYIHKHITSFLATYIIAPPGFGKTTLGCGLVNTIVDRLIWRAQATRRHITLIYHDVDFGPINEAIDRAFRDGVAPLELVRNLLCDYPMLDRVYDDKHKWISGKDLMHQYVDASYAELRDNYVYASGVDFYASFNGEKALSYDPEMIKLKDRFERKDFNIARYSVIFEDEKNDSSDDCYSTYNHVAEDGGSEAFFRLIRQIGEENIYYVTTNQDLTGSIAMERKLATSIIFVRKLITHKVKQPYQRLLDLLERVYEWKYRQRQKKLKIVLLLEDFPLRNKLFRLEQRRRELAEQEYTTLKITIYHSARDAGKKVKSSNYPAERLTWTFAEKYCHSFNTFSHSYLYDVLSQGNPTAESIYSSTDPEEMAKRLLQRRADKKELKKSVKEQEMSTAKKQAAEEFRRLKDVEK